MDDELWQPRAQPEAEVQPLPPGIASGPDGLVHSVSYYCIPELRTRHWRVRLTELQVVTLAALFGDLNEKRLVGYWHISLFQVGVERLDEMQDDLDRISRLEPGPIPDEVEPRPRKARGRLANDHAPV